MKKDLPSSFTAIRFHSYVSKLTACVLLSVIFANLIPGLVPGVKISAAGTISGRVFQDYNSNGVFDAGGVSPDLAIDNGVGSVTVTAIDAAGIVRGTTVTAANGTYNLSATGTGPYRVEFSALPAGYYPSARSTDSVAGGIATNAGSTEQFVLDGATSNVNLALSNPDDYSQNIPNVAIARLGHGDPADGSNIGRPTIYRYPYDLSGNSPNAAVANLASAPDNGAVWGLAWDRNTQDLYSAAVLKRHVGLGPNGLGAIYRTTDGNGASHSTSLFFDFGAAAGTATSNATRFSAGSGSSGSYVGDSIDASTFDSIGKAGLGDIELSEDTAILYATNLNDRKIYAINTAGTPIATQVGADAGIPWLDNTVCANGIARPWGLKTWRGSLYAGVVCDAGAALAASTCSYVAVCADLTAKVYRWNGAAWLAAPVINIPLTYPRDKFRAGATAFTWHPWANAYSNIKTHVDSTVRGADVQLGQPIVMGIEFDHEGSLILALGSRTDLQLGYNAPAPDSATAGETDECNFSSGDILRFYNSAGIQVLENNAIAGPYTGSGSAASGPGGNEFFNDRWGWSGLSRTSDSVIGGLTHLPGSRQSMYGVSDGWDFYTGGVSTLSNTDGGHIRTIEMFQESPSGPIAKAGGLGDIEILFNPAPIEIGNRVWRDLNGNGAQDANEGGIGGVTVRLYDPSDTLIGTAITDGSGEYYFSSATGISGSNVIFGSALLPETAYQVRFDDPVNYAGGGPLNGLFLTTANVTFQPGDDDSSDSDAANVTDPAGSPSPGTFPVINITTGKPGVNDHTIDAGFRMTTTAASVDLGGRILTDDGRGIANVSLTIVLANGVIRNARSSQFGYYIFEDIEVGQVVVISATAKKFVFPQQAQVFNVTGETYEINFTASP